MADLEFSQPLLSAELASRAARDYEATYGSFVGDSEIDGDARVLLDELRRDIHMVDTAEMSGRDRRRRRRQLLVAAHQGCRKTVREESQRLDHMRSEREELEAQLAAMMGGQEQDGAAMGEYIDEHGEDQEEAAEVRNGKDDDEIDALARPFESAEAAKEAETVAKVELQQFIGHTFMWAVAVTLTSVAAAGAAAAAH